MKILKYKTKFRKRDYYSCGKKKNLHIYCGIVEVGKVLPSPTVGANVLVSSRSEYG